jgi:urease accessory protein
MKVSHSMCQRVMVAISILVSLTVCAQGALAHHPLDGRLPSTWLEGFLSGLAHPILGIDHLAFVIALGLVTSVIQWGQLLPIYFLVAAMLGTGLHLQSVDLPGNEAMVAFSVILLGSILAVGQRLPFGAVAIFGAIAGLLHGYAYGEAIVGAQTTALVSYLIGFTTIQAVIALGVWAIARKTQQVANTPQSWVRLVGSGICGIGIAVLANQILG